MHGYLKQSTASQSRLVGPFLDDTDFKTAETGLTIANTDVKLCANGAASANKNSGGGTHRVNGMYGLTFDATDTATVGELAGSIVVAGALPVIFKFTVLEEAVYDALFGASALGYVANAPVNVAQVSGDATAADTLELFAEALDPSTGQLDAGSFATGTVATTEDILAGMFTTDSGETFADAVAGSVVKEIVDNAGGGGGGDATEAKQDTIIAALVTIDSNLDAVLVDTGTTLDGKLDTIDNFLDTEMAATLAAVDTEVAAIKTVTDALTSAAAAKLALFGAIVDPSTGQLDSGSFADGTLASTADLLESMFTENSGQTYDDAIAGSLVKEIADNATGADLSSDLTAVKAKTDQMTFTSPNLLNVRVNNVAGTTLAADGTGGQGIGGA